MNRRMRSAVLGMIAGAIASALLVLSLGHPWSSIVVGVLVGAAYSAGIQQTSRAYVDNLMTAGSLGIPLWGLFSVVVLPLLSGQRPEWSAEEMRALLPALVGWVLYGALLGLLTQGLRDLASHVFGPESERPAIPEEKKRIVILGGGFAGMKTAECLEQELRTYSAATITLLSETNALLFTPMLAEVAGSTLEPSHISTPLRTSLHRTEFIRGRVMAIDLPNRKVLLDSDSAGGQLEVPYDHLVLALGSVSNYLGMANIEKLAFNFKSLLDAIRIRNHVIEMFEC